METLEVVEETMEVVEGVLRGAQYSCSNTVKIWGIRTSHGEPCSRSRRDLGGKSQAWRTAYSVKLRDRPLDFQGQEGKQRQGLLSPPM